MLWRRLTREEFVCYSIAQIFGGLVGVLLTHFIFGQDLIQFSTHDRSEVRFFVSEIVATFGLLMAIALSGKRNVETTPTAIALAGFAFAGVNFGLSALTAVTIGSGFKSGEFIPLVSIGTTLGPALSTLIPVSLSLLVAVGFAAVFAGASTLYRCN